MQKLKKLLLLSLVFFVEFNLKNLWAQEFEINQNCDFYSWVDVQKRSKNAVVQIFTYKDIFNWVVPCQMPEQVSSAGSGFFIDDQGYIATNYHVINEAVVIKIQIPEFGQKRFSVDIVGACPYMDLALLKLSKDDFNFIKDHSGKISFLTFGDSDKISSAQSVMALGFPFGEMHIKSTNGLISSKVSNGLIQISAPINPGNSGGPTLDVNGNVVGINKSGKDDAQNTNFMIPSNIAKKILERLRSNKFLRNPFGVGIFNNFWKTTLDTLTYLNNSNITGIIVSKVFENSILKSLGIEQYDIFSEINGYKLDNYADLNIDNMEDYTNILAYLCTFLVGDEIDLVFYRNGQKLEKKIKLDDKYLPAVREIYPEYEKDFTDYEIIGGLIVMQLTLNHVDLLKEYDSDLKKYYYDENQQKPVLVVTHILSNSQANLAMMRPGMIIDEINNIKVHNLIEFRDAIKQSNKNDYLTIKTDQNIFIALSMKKILQDEPILASRYFYKVSDLVKAIQVAN
ncbi:trypsin-like peptidase domain-containing protein [Candidatus Dependentiae bacterium]|nr:trypsin-like peptidase domain-containing protein [Candidatus Dependentiae bacterium]MBU4387014.1 trypsin-like peptidase domain-containing protein [Candidatus Dependentiae bacterium]MCG2756095.1 trypsin-like peptidase domain-containing protein [Candidatus Dependentiae bacterium]